MTSRTNKARLEIARDALADFAGKPRAVKQLASRHNDVFRIDAITGDRFVLRIQNDLLTDAQARSQIVWLDDLARNSDVVVPAPVRTKDGRPFAHVNVGDEIRRVVLLRWLPGKPARTRHERTYRAAARMIAQMHCHAEAFSPPRGFACRRIDGDFLFGPRFFVRHLRAKKQLDQSSRHIAASAERFVREAMKSLGHGKRRFGVIHADLNLDNIIFHRGQPSPIDFDEFGKGWYLFDLAELIRTSVTPQNWKDRKKLVIDAYTAHRQLDDVALASFDAFIVATFVQYLNWAFAHARNEQDLRWVGFCLNVIRQVTRAATGETPATFRLVPHSGHRSGEARKS